MPRHGVKLSDPQRRTLEEALADEIALHSELAQEADRRSRQHLVRVVQCRHAMEMLQHVAAVEARRVTFDVSDCRRQQDRRNATSVQVLS